MRRLSNHRRLILFLTTFLLAMSAHCLHAARYKLPIKYKQTDTVVVLESRVQGWPSGHETYQRTFEDVAVSGDGSRIAFWVQVYAVGAWHLYVAKANGGALMDVTPYLPDNWQIGLLDINHDGSKIYGGGGEHNWACDISGPTPVCSRAVFSGSWNGDNRKPFTINRDGSRVFFKHEANGQNKGLYKARLGGVPQKVLDLGALPCDSECGNMNMLAFLGASRNFGRMFLTYDRDYWGTVPPSTSTAMFYVSGGAPVRIPDEEHDYVWSLQDLHNDIVSADGRRALYYYWDSDWKDRFHWVDVATGKKTLIAKAKPNFNATISADGKVVLFSSGSEYRATRVNLANRDERDTGSYFIPNSYDQWFHSGLTVNKRYYYNGAAGAAYRYLRKVDMGPKTVGKAPNITAITCTAPALIHADGVTVTVTARVMDAQGLKNIDWVNLSTLVEGREQPSWPMGRAPLAFPSGDPGSTRMYDDGTHGDAVAGDGIFTFDSVATRKGDYDGWNTWYKHFTLPHPVGLRIIAKDKNENYTIADTLLKIAYIYAAPAKLILHPGDVARSSIFGAGGPYRVRSNNTDVATARVSGAKVLITARNAGKAVLRISDSEGHIFRIAVNVVDL